MSDTTTKPLSEWNNEDFLTWSLDPDAFQEPPSKSSVLEAIAQKTGIVGEESEALYKQVFEYFDALEKETKTASSETDSTATETPPEPVKSSPEESTAPEPKPAPKAVSEPVKQKPAPAQQKVSLDNNPSASIIRSNLSQYIERMKPGVTHAGNEGVSMQTKLFRTIQTIFRQQGSDFVALYSELLETVHRHRQDVFNERYAFRYFERLSMTKKDQRNFENVLSMLLDTCDPKLRHRATQQVDIPLVMSGFSDTDVQQRVLSFYQSI